MGVVCSNMSGCNHYLLIWRYPHSLPCIVVTLVGGLNACSIFVKDGAIVAPYIALFCDKIIRIDNPSMLCVHGYYLTNQDNMLVLLGIVNFLEDSTPSICYLVGSTTFCRHVTVSCYGIFNVSVLYVSCNKFRLNVFFIFLIIVQLSNQVKTSCFLLCLYSIKDAM